MKMSKAGTVLRRSGVVLKSLGSANTNLQLLINQLKETRSLNKAMASSQSAANHDLIKWAEQEENRAIKETVSHVGELLVFYTEIQKSFTDRLKEFTYQFEMILEGEKLVSGAKSQLEVASEKENRMRKEVKKASKRRDSGPELHDWTEKLVQAQHEKDLAQLELQDRIREHEAVKLIRLKSGLLKWSNAHKEATAKTNLLFSATHDIAQLIPDIADTSEIQDIRYTGGPAALRITMETKERLQRQDQPALTSTTTSTYPDDLPPPYAEIQPPQNPYYSTDGATSGYDYSLPNSQNSSCVSFPNSTNTSAYLPDSSFAQDDDESAPDGGQNTNRRRSSTIYSDLRKRLSQISLSNGK